MCRYKTILLLFILLVWSIQSFGQRSLGIRIAANTGMFIAEVGEDDIPHPLAEQTLLTTTTEKFNPQFRPGIEAEFLIQLNNRSFLGVEVEGNWLSGYNDNPPAYNYYFTDENPIGTYVTDPVAFNTSEINIVGTWWYYLTNTSEKWRPFAKLTAGVGVAFIGTDFIFKYPEDASMYESDVLYTRGTGNDDRSKWPAMYFGGGMGLEYKFADNLSFVMDASLNAVHSDIVNGVPNFHYQGGELDYRNRLSLTSHLSAGLKYTWLTKKRPGRRSGKVHPYFPFYKLK